LSAHPLYQEKIKALAAEAAGHGTLASPDGHAFIDNPLCGDSVGMHVNLAEDRIAALAHEVRGCLLCRAAASILGRHALGRTAAEIERAGAALRAMLEKDAPPPPDWPELEVFVPVRTHRSRYQCVRLPFEALLAALHAAAETR